MDLSPLYSYCNVLHLVLHIVIHSYKCKFITIQQVFDVLLTNRKAESILDSAVMKFKQRASRHLPTPLIDDALFYPQQKDIQMVHYQHNRLVIKDKVMKDQRPKKKLHLQTLLWNVHYYNLYTFSNSV